MSSAVDLPNPNNLEDVWAYVEKGLDILLVKPLDEVALSPQMYMGMYSIIHNYCTNVPVSNTPFWGSDSSSSSEFRGVEIYQRLSSYLNRRLSTLKSEVSQYQDEELIKEYMVRFTRYSIGAKYLTNVFAYINRHWVPRQRDDGHTNVYDVYTLCLMKWKNSMLFSCSKLLTDAALAMIRRDRDGEAISTPLLSGLIQSLVALGIDGSDYSVSSHQPGLSVYEECFEGRFLEATAQYYKEESQRFIASHSVVQYMRKAESRIAEETKRLDEYLAVSTTPKLLNIVHNVLIADYSDILVSEHRALLDSHSITDLSCIYRLLSLIPDGLKPLMAEFELYVRKQGTLGIQQLLESSAASANQDAKAATRPAAAVDPQAYVSTLLRLHSTYASLVQEAYGNNPEFVKALDNACRDFINDTKTFSKAVRAPDIIARYCDTLLRKSSASSRAAAAAAVAVAATSNAASASSSSTAVDPSTNANTISSEDDLEAALNDVMTIFFYIDDKDVFQKSYARALARRLVNGISISDAAEASMISKLKDACGFDYISVLQRMFQDINISSDLTQAFKTSAEKEDLPLDMEMLVLGSNFWTMQPAKTDFQLPPLLQESLERFEKFYQSKHSGRKLEWLYNHCKGEMRATYNSPTGNGTVTYTFQVSAFQMAILLSYNDKDTLTYRELESITKLNKDFLAGSLSILLKAKVLLKEPQDATIEDPETRFIYNTGFRGKRLRVNLNQPLKFEQQKEAAATQKNIEEDRKVLIQSAIVRVMKARKQLKHVQLVQETITQISSRFSPSIGEIKKCIDLLIDKEYIARVDAERYQYLA
ncbi:hypothetical protein CANCADRAFT_78572 [Tortispora caseinolytica NRRL Y-17796]|uniref:Cullin family profile domain-containing protein n=1 Tax=Tortispora caseinolytica NRRL Y-17796 TaxID=767744 RepID=A0A1E4TJE3_9ASCO|nr:hypothetical protein CANCADRAFT_78572 [Tortispora caseinolytica NRRL Y-17796]